MASVLKRRLERRGFDVIECHNFDSALSALQQPAVDLALCDIQLGEARNGLDLFNEIRINQGKKIPFVFLTGHGEGTEEVDRAVASGAEAVFSKPMDFQVIISKVTELLGVNN